MLEHLPRHVLEALADPGVGAGEGGVREHLEACAHCSSRLAAIDAARASYLEAFPEPEFVATVTRRARQLPPQDGFFKSFGRHLRAAGLRYALGTALVGALATMLLWVQPEGGAEIRLKGPEASLEVHARRSGRVWQPRAGEPLRAGDELAFVYSAATPVHVLLLGVDDAGKVQLYYPKGAATPLLATARDQLPIGLELDARAGVERLFAFFSDRPLDAASVRQAVRREIQRNGIMHVDRVELEGESATQATFWYRKR